MSKMFQDVHIKRSERVHKKLQLPFALYCYRYKKEEKNYNALQLHVQIAAQKTVILKSKYGQIKQFKCIINGKDSKLHPKVKGKRKV